VAQIAKLEKPYFGAPYEFQISKFWNIPGTKLHTRNFEIRGFKGTFHTNSEKNGEVKVFEVNFIV
jgi:hypothetical protein